MTAAEMQEMMMAILGGLLLIVGTLLSVLYSATQNKLKEYAMKFEEASKTYATKEELRDMGRRVEQGLSELKEEVKAGNQMHRELLMKYLSADHKTHIEMNN